jgi:hypothetical protein
MFSTMKTAAGFLVLVAGLSAQAPKDTTRVFAPLRAGPVYPPDKPDKAVEIVVDLVPPSDPQQSPNLDQIRDNSMLVEEKKPSATADQAIEFGKTDKQVAIAIVVDVSAGMRGERLDSVRRGLLEVIASKRNQDKVALVVFSDSVNVLANFGSSKDELTGAINSLAKLPPDRNDYPRLYRAIDRALKLFDPASPARRRVMVVAQGKNPGAGEEIGFQPNDVIGDAQRMQIPIDTIGVPAPAPVMTDDEKLAEALFDRSTNYENRKKGVLGYLESMEKLANQTQGMYLLYNPRNERGQKIELGERLNYGVKWLMNSPVLHFPIQNLPFDGKRHEIGVKVSGVEIPLPEALLLYEEEGFPQFLKKYGIYVAGTVVVLIVLLLATQRMPRRPVRFSGATPASATPRPARANSPRPLQMAGSSPPPPVMNRPPSPANAWQGLREQGRPQGESGTPPRRSGTLVVQSTFPAPAPGNPTCSLLVLTGSHAGTRLPVEGDQVLLGRGLNHPLACSFDPAISDPHAQIRYQGGIVMIVDLNSSNGTFVNGQKLVPGQPLSISLGDRLHMGQTDFQVV